MKSVKLFIYKQYNYHEFLIPKKNGGVKKRRSAVDGELLYEIIAPILGGNSGGPVVNKMNEVVGVAVRGREQYPNEIIPISKVLEYATT